MSKHGSRFRIAALLLITLGGLAAGAPRAGAAPPLIRPGAGWTSATSLPSSGRFRIADRCDGRPCIQVGTFNLYWLGVKNRSGDLPLRSQTDVERLVELVVDRLDLEVVALQEINTDIDEVSNNVTTKSTTQWQQLQQALADRGYEVTHGVTGFAQHVAVAWDPKVVDKQARQELLVRTSFDFGDGCDSSGLRAPLAVQFTAKQLSFWVVAVHLKSKIDGECSDRIRKLQTRDMLRAIRKQLKARRGHVFIAGDFNATASDESLQPLRGGGFRPLTAKAKRGPGSGDVSFLKEPFRALIDHVMYRKRDSKRAWVRKSTMVFDPDTAGTEFADFINRFSDHAPVYTSFFIDG